MDDDDGETRSQPGGIKADCQRSSWARTARTKETGGGRRVEDAVAETGDGT